MDMQLEVVTQFVRPPLICDQIFCIVKGGAAGVGINTLGTEEGGA